MFVTLRWCPAAGENTTICGLTRSCSLQHFRLFNSHHQRAHELTSCTVPQRLQPFRCQFARPSQWRSEKAWLAWRGSSHHDAKFLSRRCHRCSHQGQVVAFKFPAIVASCRYQFWSDSGFQDFVIILDLPSSCTSICPLGSPVDSSSHFSTSLLTGLLCRQVKEG